MWTIYSVLPNNVSRMSRKVSLYFCSWHSFVFDEYGVCMHFQAHRLKNADTQTNKVRSGWIHTSVACSSQEYKCLWTTHTNNHDLSCFGGSTYTACYRYKDNTNIESCCNLFHSRWTQRMMNDMLLFKFGDFFLLSRILRCAQALDSLPCKSRVLLSGTPLQNDLGATRLHVMRVMMSDEMWGGGTCMNRIWDPWHGWMHTNSCIETNSSLSKPS